MSLTLRVEFKLIVEGQREPELEGYQRIPWPDDQTLDDVARAWLEKVCLQLHTQKAWKPV